MSSTLTLLTSDTPPISISASRIALHANSKVFSDMLSLPSSSTEDNSVTLAETEKEIKPFLVVVQGKGGRKGGEVEKLDEEGWENLARLADKFDAPLVVQLIEKRIWELEAKPGCPLHAFTLATWTNKRELLHLTLPRVFDVEDRGSTRFGATEEWKERLLTWEAKRASLAYKLIKEAAATVAATGRCSYSEEGDCEVAATLAKHFLSALAVLKACDAEWRDLDHHWSGSIHCRCRKKADKAVEDLQKKWAEGHEFPYGD